MRCSTRFDDRSVAINDCSQLPVIGSVQDEAPGEPTGLTVMKILAAIDLSRASEKVIRALQPLSLQMAAETWLLHVAEPDPAFVGYEAGPQVVRDQVAHKFRLEHEKLHEIADALRAEGIKTTALVVQGPTVQTILDEAGKMGVDLIVVGSHGYGAMHQLLVGSVSEGVIRRSSRPVLVVPTHERI